MNKNQVSRVLAGLVIITVLFLVDVQHPTFPSREDESILDADVPSLEDMSATYTPLGGSGIPSPPPRTSVNLRELVEDLIAVTVDMTDSDVDGLPDSVEVVIGTDPTNNDTDYDRLTDYDEIWDNLDPLERDTNRDGLPDYYEVTTIAEQDLDGDGLVNAWDFDNDGDEVNDAADLSPFARSAPYESFHFEITTNGTPTYLTFQLRPENPNYLKLMEQVWDWPNDEEGLMRDMDGSLEDVTVVPVLNLTLPAHMLPDQADVIDYGIRIEDNSMYVPLAPVKEFGTIVAFSGKLFYPAASGPLNLVMDAQLFWRVIGQTDNIAKALTAHNGENVSVSSGGALVTTSNDFPALETFHWIDLGNNQVALKAANGLYVSVSEDAVVATGSAIGDWETFDLIDQGANQIALKAYNERYVSVSAGGTLFANSSALTAAETFDVIHLGYISDPITLAIYQEPFMLTGFLAEENYGTDIGVLSSANENHTKAANLALDFDYLRNATIHLAEMTPLLEAKYNVSVISDIRPFSHRDAGFMVLALNMTPTALDSLPPAQVLPLITAVEDRSTSIDLVQLVPSSYVLGDVCAVNLAAGDQVTSKTLKMDWYNTTSYVPLTLDELLTEVQSWGLEEQATDTLMGIMQAWHSGIQTITQIGNITLVFDPGELPDPGVLGTIITETSNGVTYTAATHAMAPWFYKFALKGGATWGRIGTALNAVAWVVCAVQVAVSLYQLSQILGSSEYSYEEKVMARMYILMQVYYAILLTTIGMIPYVGWAIVLALTLMDLLGETKGWVEKAMTWVVEQLTDTRYLTQYVVWGGESSLTLEDLDHNRLDVGDRIVINSTVFAKINATEYGDWEDISSSYVNMSCNIWVPPWSFSNTSSFKQASWTTDYQTYNTTQYDLGVSVQPGLDMPNFPVKVWLSVDYQIFYEFGEYRFIPLGLLFWIPLGWKWHTRTLTNTTETDPITIFFDVLPGTITDFVSWPGITSLDHDGDGLKDTMEVSTYHTHPWRWDTDSDGLNDNYELVIGTDPTNFDSDNDGVFDYYELVYGTNATQRDSDEDGLPDYVEEKGWIIAFNYSDSVHEFTLHVRSDPNWNDTDGDGLSDQMEYWSNLNPRSRDTNGDGMVDEAQPGVETHLEVEWQSSDLFNNPRGVTIDPNDGSVFVADTENHQIQKFADNGTFLDTLGSWGSEAEQFKSPNGISVDSQGTVYVADTGNDRIQVFNSTGTFLPSWSNTFRSMESNLLASNGDTDDRLGWSVAINEDGNTMVAGAIYAEGHMNRPKTGAAYVFVREDKEWREQAKLVAPDGASFHMFGFSVAISGDGNIVVVGAPQAVNSNNNKESGAAYVFLRSGETWSAAKKIDSNTPGINTGALFGNSVAVSREGEVVVVGAPQEYYLGDYRGAAYVFRRSGDTWIPSKKLFHSETVLHGYDMYGWSVAVSRDGNTIAVGAPGRDNVYMYIGEQLIEKLTGPEPPPGHLSNDYGCFVAFDEDGGTLVVASAGEVFVYAYREPYKLQIQLNNTLTGIYSYGCALNLGGDILVVGQYSADYLSYEYYVYKWNGTEWSQQATFAGDINGNQVVLSADGNTVIFGNDRDDTQGQKAGAVYVYRRTFPLDISVVSNPYYKTGDPKQYIETKVYVSCYDDGYASIRYYEFDDGNTGDRIEYEFGREWLDRPLGVAVDPTEGAVYVADSGADRIVKFDADGAFLEVIPDGLSNPQGVAIDSEGNLYVADTGNNHIKKFDPNGMLLTSRDCSAPPQDVAVDSENSVYVLEGNHLVKYSQQVVFTRPEVPDPIPDRDGDGLDNDFESNSWDVTFTNATGTFTLHVTSDPLLPDTDFDGLSDFNESVLLSNPRNPDTDSDGTSDFEEWGAGTDLNHYDTDDDGLDDGIERTYGSDPADNDTEDDGLTDREEFDLYSNPRSNDTDGDGLTDGQEQNFNSSLLSPDTDGDLMFDGAEAFYNTDPQNNDTDGDNLPDGSEVFYDTDPKNNDTDGDGLLDGMEVEQRIDPKNNDTDGDGTPDGTELEQGTNPVDSDTDGDGIPDSVDDDSSQLFGEPIILAYDPSEEGVAFAETLAQYAPVTVVSLEELVANYTEAPYIVLVGRPEVGNDTGTVGNLSYELLIDTGEVLLQMQETDVYRLAVRYGQWAPTQTIVLLSHPYPADHFRVLNIFMRQTVTIQPDSALVEYNGSLLMETYDGETMVFFMVDEIDTVKATDTLLFVLLEEDIQPWVELSRYNDSTTPVALTPSSGLEGSDKAMDKYLNITVSPNLQNDTTDLIASAMIQLYYTEADLDRTGDGDANDPQDFNESTLVLYWLNESSGNWEKLNNESEWVYETGVNTTDVELYDESYKGYVWASVFNFSTYGVAGLPNNRPPDVSSAYPSQEYLWPPNHKFVEVTIEGVTDPDGDSVIITITSITSDEPTDSLEEAGGSNHAPDAYGIGTDTAHLRAERSGTGNGRVYEITFVAIDGKGGETESTVTVCVPHHPKRGLYYCIDDGQIYDATEGLQQGKKGINK